MLHTHVQCIQIMIIPLNHILGLYWGRNYVFSPEEKLFGNPDTCHFDNVLHLSEAYYCFNTVSDFWRTLSGIKDFHAYPYPLTLNP